MERKMIIDTETTGLPDKGLHWSTDYGLFPHIVEIAWKIEDREHSFILNQCGRKIPKEATEVHGITNQMAMASPYTFRHIVPLLLHDAEQANILVGHNFYFDTSIIKANIIRDFGTDDLTRVCTAFDKSKRIDTLRMAMKMKMGFLSLPGLHEKLFGCGYKCHRAMDDLLATERCYNELLSRKQSLSIL